jgi:phosphoglycolate phosphatase-like HAD superfamily hydrolase
MIGDILDDVEAGHLAGCRSILLLNGGETLWRLSANRVPDAISKDLEGAAEWILFKSNGRPPLALTEEAHAHV